MARFSSSRVAIFTIIIVESVVTGEKLSLRGSSAPSANPVLFDDEVSAPMTQTDGPITSIVDEHHVGFDIEYGAGTPDLGFSAEARGALSRKQRAAASLAPSGARKGPGLLLASANANAASPGLRSASANSSVPIVSMASTGTQSFGAHNVAASCFQWTWAKITHGWVHISQVVRAASTLQIATTVEAFRSFRKAEPTLAMFLIVGLFAMLTGTGWWLNSACNSFFEKKSKSRKPSAARDDPLAYAFAARRHELCKTATVGSYLPWSIRA